jgi:hypothetical protein
MAADAAEEGEIHFGTAIFRGYPSSNFLTVCSAAYILLICS